LGPSGPGGPGEDELSVSKLKPFGPPKLNDKAATCFEDRLLLTNRESNSKEIKANIKILNIKFIVHFRINIVQNLLLYDFFVIYYLSRKNRYVILLILSSAWR
jgi:hypothetical protein